MTTQQPETTPSREAFASQLQVFASAWAIVGQFDAGDGMQTADAERAIVLDMWRRLHTENEALRAGYAAARLEIASLQAQLEAVATPAQPLHVAAISCPHEIDKDKIVLHFDSKQPGKNALAQLAARLQAAHAQPVAMPTAQALDSVRVFWQQHTQADALSMTMAELHDDVELVIRAARGAAQAAPVDAVVQEDAERWQFFAEYLVSTRTDLDDEIVGCDSVQKMSGVIDAAIAAQKGGA